MNTIKVVKTFDAAVSDAHKSMLKAAALTLNQAAYQASQSAKENVKSKFVLRNNFTANSIRYTKCPRADSIANMKSETGILERAGYMARQEEGGRKTAPGNKNLIIPNTKARGGNNRAVVKNAYRYANLKRNFYPRVVDGKPSKSKMALAVAAKNAADHKGFIRLNETIVQVTRFMPKSSNGMFSAKPILNLKHESVNVPKTEWLRPASDSAASKMQVYFNKSMDSV